MDQHPTQEPEEESSTETVVFGVPLAESAGIIGWGTLVIAIYIALTVGTGGYDERSVSTVVRWTGRISMLVFLLAYLRPWFTAIAAGETATETATETSPAAWAIRNYRYLLLLLASSHTIHLTALGVLATQFAREFELVTVAVGGLGYVFIYVLAIGAAANRLATDAARAGFLESLATHYVWGVFVITSATNIVEKPEVVPFVIAGLAAAYYRRSAGGRSES